MENAYAPYSNYHVGAALRLKNGVEIVVPISGNASFGATCCAESTIFQTYSQGYH